MSYANGDDNEDNIDYMDFMMTDAVRNFDDNMDSMDIADESKKRPKKKKKALTIWRKNCMYRTTFDFLLTEPDIYFGEKSHKDFFRKGNWKVLRGENRKSFEVEKIEQILRGTKILPSENQKNSSNKWKIKAKSTP